MVIDYTKATDEEISSEMVKEFKVTKLAEIEAEKVKTFETAKEVERAKLVAKQDEKIIAFGQACQIAEDADYDITKIPDGDTY